MTSQTQTLTSEITAILAADEWHPKWAACQNAMTDPYGNTVAIHDYRTHFQPEKMVAIDFEYAVGSIVEHMELDPSLGARRIALAILALAAPPDDETAL